MTYIEIQKPTGEIEQRQLSRAAPLSIGSHSSNNLCIEGDGVGVLHCRISWNGRQFEVMSGGSGGVDVNGHLLQHAPLTEGDLLRIGGYDIVFRGNGASGATPRAKPEPGGIGLKPVTDDEIPVLKRATDVAREMAGGRGRPAPGPEAFPQPPPPPRATPAAADPDDDEDELDDLPHLNIRRRKSQEKTPALAELKQRLAGRPARPGEQDVVRSPLVLGLGGGVLALLLAAATVWFIIGRETAQKHFDAAIRQAAEGNDKQAAELFESFLQEHPRHERAEQARYGLGQARIRLALAGATPNWPRGLDELEAFVRQHRDRPNYQTQVETLQQQAADIAFGAARSVADSARRPNIEPEALHELLGVSRAAGGLVSRLHPPDEQPTELASQLADAHWQAEQAIATREDFLSAIDSIEKSIVARRPHDALALRHELLTAHANFRDDPKLAQLLQAALDVEQALVDVEEIDQPALTTDRQRPGPPPLSFVRQTRSGTGETSVGRTVFAIAKDCCYGIDTVTGRPLWRRAIGMDAPFFPLPVDTSSEALLLFDTAHNELTLLERRTGKLLWRQPLGEAVRGEPLLYDGRAYLATSSGTLYQVVLDTGLLARRLTFSQPLVGPPVLIRGESQLVVAGRASVLYTLSLRPLGCLAVSFAGHAAGAVDVPLLAMGPLLLLTENSNINGGRIRVFDTRGDKQTVEEIAAAPIAGRVHNRPIIRGRQLFVASSPERITAFSVSDHNDQPPLVRVAETRIAGEHSGPLFLKAGADGQLWMAGSAFRRFRLMTDAIAYDEAERTAAGITTQPLQLVDRHFFIGRRRPWHRAVLFTPVEREQLTSRWRTVCGAAPLAVMADDRQLVCVTETGDIYRVEADRLREGGFVGDATSSLPIADDTIAPLSATRLADDRLAVWSGNPEPTLWVVDRSDRVMRTIDLPQPLEAGPVAIDAGLVLPLPGRLKVAATTGGSPPEDYPAPLQPGQTPHWRHLVPLDGDEFLAIDDGGRLARMQFRQSPVPHLKEVDSVDLPHPLIAAPIAAGDRFFSIDADGRLTMRDLPSLEPLSEIALDAPTACWHVDGRLYVACGRQALRSFHPADRQLREDWTLPLEGRSLAGAPLPVGDRVIVALQNGDVLSLGTADGEIRNHTDVNQRLAGGPRRMGDWLLLPTLDGSLQSLATDFMREPQP